MKINVLDDQVSVSEQITVDDIKLLVEDGVKVVVCNRPDGEAEGQASAAEIEAFAIVKGMRFIHIPFTGGNLSEQQVTDFGLALAGGERLHAYCRTGNRCSIIWARARAEAGVSHDSLVTAAKQVGYDLSGLFSDTAAEVDTSVANTVAKPCYDIVVVGAGSGGVAICASLLKRKPNLRIALIDAATKHYYQPGWTMVGGGVFDASSTEKNMVDVIPKSVHWLQHNVVAFNAAENCVRLDDDSEVYYQQLVVSPGLVLNWSAIEGLEETLGKNGVTSNYRYDLAPYTWELVQNLQQGTALFTQPPMPIKCAGAPQKALYLSADHWFKQGRINNINVEFCNAGGVLFGVADYVPALMSYMEKYQAKLNFMHTLVKVDGPAKQAWFKDANSGSDELICKSFDMLHVCPPQQAPAFIRDSELADAEGWLAINPATLQHTGFENIWGLGDVMNTTNAKTMAAVRKQVPIVANNICAVLDGKAATKEYDGYGSCPLTVERGKIVLAEFCYGGKVSPSFPKWLNDGTKPSRQAWLLKAMLLPAVYWHAMLKGREWLTSSTLPS